MDYRDVSAVVRKADFIRAEPNEEAVRPGSIIVEPSSVADATAKAGNYVMTLVGYAQMGADPDVLRTPLVTNRSL